MSESSRADVEELRGVFNTAAEAFQKTTAVQEFMARADVHSLTTARDTLCNFGHDPAYRNPNDLDPESAVAEIQAYIDVLDSILVDTEDEENAARAQRNKAILEAELAGYQYRKEHQLPGVFVQQDKARERMKRLYDDPNASKELTDIMEDLYQQADAGSVIDELKAEYQEIMNLLEAFSEDPENMTLDVNELWQKFFSQNRGLDFDSTDELIFRLRKARAIQKNISQLTRLAELQGNSGYINEMKEAAVEQEEAILKRAADNLSFRRGVIEQEISSALGQGIIYDDSGKEKSALPALQQIEAELAALQQMYEDEDKMKQELEEARAERAKLEKEEKDLQKKAGKTVRRAVVSILLAVKKDVSDPLEKRLLEKQEEVRQARLAERKLEVTLRVLEQWRDSVTQLETNTQRFIKSVKKEKKK